MNDDLIIQKFITDKNKINSHYKQIINKNQEIKEYLDNRYKDGNNDYCETLYRIQHHLDKHPVCPNCGKYVKFISGTCYRGSCSVSFSKNYIKDVVKYIIYYLDTDTDKDIIIDVNNDIGDIYNIKKYCCYYKNIDSYEDFVIRKDDTALAKKNDKFVVRCYNSGITEFKVKLL